VVWQVLVAISRAHAVATVDFGAEPEARAVDSELHIVIRKLLTHSNESTIRVGIIGAVAIVRVLGQRRSEEEEEQQQAAAAGCRATRKSASMDDDETQLPGGMEEDEDEDDDDTQAPGGVGADGGGEGAGAFAPWAMTEIQETVALLNESCLAKAACKSFLFDEVRGKTLRLSDSGRAPQRSRCSFLTLPPPPHPARAPLHPVSLPCSTSSSRWPCRRGTSTPLSSSG
jgi:hypothetical protein